QGPSTPCAQTLPSAPPACGSRAAYRCAYRDISSSGSVDYPRDLLVHRCVRGCDAARACASVDPSDIQALFFCLPWESLSRNACRTGLALGDADLPPWRTVAPPVQYALAVSARRTD